MRLKYCLSILLALTSLLSSSKTASAQETETRYDLRPSTIRFVVKEFLRYDSLRMEYAYQRQREDTLISIIMKKDRAIEAYQANEKRYEMIIGNAEAQKASLQIRINEGLKREKRLIRIGRVKNVTIGVSIAAAGYFAYRALK